MNKQTPHKNTHRKSVHEWRSWKIGIRKKIAQESSHCGRLQYACQRACVSVCIGVRWLFVCSFPYLRNWIIHGKWLAVPTVNVRLHNANVISVNEYRCRVGRSVVVTVFNVVVKWMRAKAKDSTQYGWKIYRTAWNENGENVCVCVYSTMFTKWIVEREWHEKTVVEFTSIHFHVLLLSIYLYVRNGKGGMRIGIVLC